MIHRPKMYRPKRPGSAPKSDSLPDETFSSLWRDLFTSKTHLDALLARLNPKKKSIHAQILPRILAQPVSLASELGVGVRSGEPWNLKQEDLAEWPAARQLADRLVQHLDRGIPEVKPMPEDFPPSWNLPTDLLGALSALPPLSLRISRSLSPADALKQLKAEKDLSSRAAPSTLSPVGLRFEKYTAVLHSRLYEEGKFEIQDEGSQLMALFALQPDLVSSLLTEKPGKHPKQWTLPALPKFPAWTVIDACAGAGGKSLALADYLENRGRLFAYDISERKIQSLRQRARRGQWSNLKAMAIDPADGAALTPYRASADRVLVDAPCSGWGVLRRNPDTKWRENEEQLAKFPEVQLMILRRYASLVKAGGILTYGVCTFRDEETRQVVARFEAEEPGYKRIAGGFLGPDLTDGFFMTAWERRE